jgi:alginate O-acetyltransferase complex protein AlgJ
MVIFLAGAGVMATADVLHTRKEAGNFADNGFLNGQWATLYEKDFNKHIGVYQASIYAWGALNYALYKNGKEGVLVGRDGWLFTKEEFDHYPDAQKKLKQKLDCILKVRDFLKTRDVRLLVLPLPSKARIYRDRLGRYMFPDYNEQIFDDFMKGLFQRNITAAAIRSVFLERKDKTNVFLKTDTHWSPYGARIAAREISLSIAKEFPDISYQKRDYRTEYVEMLEHEGDLLRYVPLGNMASVLGPEKDRMPVMRTIEIGAGGAGEAGLAQALFRDASIPVALVGTSYSANRLWNFEGFLKEELQADVLNVSDEGLGPFKTMENYLKNEAFTSSPPEIVIWEIPERYLPVEYEAAFTKKKGDEV